MTGEPRRIERVRPPPELRSDAHKGDAGRVLCLAGSATMPGAAVLVVRAACRAGAGLVTLGCLARELLTIVPSAAPEALLLDLTSAAAALAAGGERAELPAGRLAALLERRADHAIVVGPGLGRGALTRALVRHALAAEPAAPAVLDADALNEVGRELESLAEARAELVLTPHPGEAARLLGRDVPADDAGRLRAALEIARRARAVTCLKGRRTVVVDAAGERVYVNQTGNPGMATGGTGDVLAGILGAYLAAAGGDAARYPAFEAALAAVEVHGRAGDLAARALGRRALIASDLIEFLAQAQRERESPEPAP